MKSKSLTGLTLLACVLTSGQLASQNRGAFGRAGASSLIHLPGQFYWVNPFKPADIPSSEITAERA